MTTKTAPQKTASKDAAVAEPDNEISKILAKHVTNTPTGLIFDDSLDFEDWMKTYRFYLLVHNKSAWLLGDCLRHGEVYGEKYAQAVDIGKSTSYLSSIVSICGRFSDLTRRREGISFEHHAAVAYLPPQTADHILDQAEKLSWNRDETRDAAAKAKGLPTKAQRAAAKQAKLNGQVKLLPPAANPPTLDGHVMVEPKKAYIWNGRPVTAREGDLYSGAEKMTIHEQDSCAHQYEFADAEAMIHALNGSTPPKPQEAPPAPATTPTLSTSPSVLPMPPTASQTPAATEIEPDQGVAVERCVAALNRFVESIPTVDWSKVTPLQRKTWLLRLVPIDELIDTLQKP